MNKIDSPETIDGVPVLKPSYEQFKDFQKYIQVISKLGNESGILKIIPPKEWIQLLDIPPPVESLQRIKFSNFFRQRISGGVDGFYLLENEKVYSPTSNDTTLSTAGGRGSSYEVDRSNVYYDVIQWKNMGSNNNDINNNNSTTVQDFERFRNEEYNSHSNTVQTNNDKKQKKLKFLEQDYWENLSKMSSGRTSNNNSNNVTDNTGLCGVDATNSLFPTSLHSWNVSRLPTSISDYLSTSSNNSSKLVAGHWMSTVPCTSQRQNDLCSISFIHLGAPKQWYVIPKTETAIFDKFTKSKLSTTKATSALLETQKYVVSPTALQANGIRVNKITQFQNEFILTFPCTCYEAFDYGYNVTETARFSSTVDDWTPRISQGINIIANDIMSDNKAWDRESSSNISTPLPSLPNLLSNQNISLRSTSPGPGPGLGPGLGRSPTPLGIVSGGDAGVGTIGMNLNAAGTSANTGMYSAVSDSTHSMGPTQQDFQQLSRVSSPLLSKMMDLSNIVEPTLDDSNLKFQSRRRYGSPQSLRLDDTALDGVLRRPLSRSGTGSMFSQQKYVADVGAGTGVVPNSSSIGAASTTTTVGSANNNGINATNVASGSGGSGGGVGLGSTSNSASQTPTLVPLALRTCTVPSVALFDYNDDNLLALSLTSMANSSHSSPRLRKPMLNSPIDNPLNSIDSNKNYGVSNTFRTNSNGTTNFPYPFAGAPDRRTGQGNPNLNINSSSNSNSNNSIGIGSVNKPSSPLMHVQSSGTNSNPSYTLPFLKRVKSSNVVTLNVSRETSRSPVPMASTDTNQVPSAVSSGMSTAPSISMNQYSYMTRYTQPEESKFLQNQTRGQNPGQGQSRSQSQIKMQQPSAQDIGYGSFDLGSLPLNKKPKLQSRVVSSPSALSVLAMTSSPLINEAELGPTPTPPPQPPTTATTSDMRSLANSFPLVGLKNVSSAMSLQSQAGPRVHSPPSEMATLALRNSQFGQQRQQQQQQQRQQRSDSGGGTLFQGAIEEGEQRQGLGQGQSHRQEKEKDPASSSKTSRIYICQECKRHFSSGHHLTRHRKSVHSGEKPFSCPKCGKKFKRRDHVLQHLNKKIPCITGTDSTPVVPHLHTHAQGSSTTTASPSPPTTTAAATTNDGKGLFLVHLNSGKEEGYARS